MRKAIETSQQAPRQATNTASAQDNIMLEAWQMSWGDFKRLLRTSFRLWAFLIVVFCLLTACGINWLGIFVIFVIVGAVCLLEDFLTRYPDCKYKAEQERKKAREKEQQEQKLRIQKEQQMQKLRIQMMREQQEREARDKQFFELSETTCNRCGCTVRAHKRILDVAHYTCDYCRKSFTVRLYNPDRIK